VPDPVDVSIPTADGYKLAGTLYAAPADSKGPCVLMLHDVGFGIQGRKGRDWLSLATALQKQGCSVLTFDFRGFGDNRTSAELLPATFFRRPANALLLRTGMFLGPRGGRGQVQQSVINSNFFTNQYLPWLVQDVVAARLWLDLQHDAGKVNSSNLVLIAEGESTRLGAVWLATESRRYKTGVLVPGVAPGMSLYESRDLRGAVWIDVRPTGRVPAPGDLPVVRKQLAGEKAWPPMLFLYNQNVTTEAQVNVWAKAFRQADRAPAGKKGIAAAVGPFAGVGSLLSKAGVSRDVRDFVAAVAKSGDMKPAARRNVQAGEYVWQIGGATRRAKMRNSTVPLLAPLDHWGFTLLPGK
jgi:hypothetical protein